MRSVAPPSLLFSCTRRTHHVSRGARARGADGHSEKRASGTPTPRCTRRSDAVRRGHLAVNPVDAVDPPACDESVERTAWTAPRCARSWTWPPAIDSPRSGVSRSPPDSAGAGYSDWSGTKSTRHRSTFGVRCSFVFGRSRHAPAARPVHTQEPARPARHSYAELALSSGVRLVVVSRTLGHSSSAFTADQYSHCSDEAAAEADRIGAVLRR